jgi:hypothetical protein
MSVRRRRQDLCSTTSQDEVILQIDHIQTFLIELGARLENDGFAENHQTRYFIRSIDDLGRQLRHQVRGGIWQGSGGEGSGSE